LCNGNGKVDTPSTAPTGVSPQTLCDANTKLSDLQVMGTGIQWYDAAVGGNLLVTNSLETNRNAYYASQTVGVCESTNRLAVVASFITCEQGISYHGALTTNPAEGLDRYGRIGNPLEYIGFTGKNIYIGARYTMTAPTNTFLSVYDTDYLPETTPTDLSTVATNQPADGVKDRPIIEVAGVLTTTGITISLSYTATQTGVMAPYKSTLVIAASYTQY
jgi:hypothetical protein